MPDLSLDRRAAAQATVLATAVLVTLLFLQGGVTATLTSGTQPMAAAEQVPTDPQATTWDDAPSRTVTLSKQQMAVPFGGGSIDEMTVRALANESHVAFHLSWIDPTNDTSLGSPQAYSDAVAIMLHSGSTPPITMGAVGEPVNIWYWRASWEFGTKDAPWSGDMYAYPHPDNRTRPGAAAGNPLSKAGYDQFAQNYYAKGYGSLSHAPVQPVQANAVRTADGWRVTFVRERGTDGVYDATFDGDHPMYLAFAVWNGSVGDVNGEKSLTMQYTRLDPLNGTLAAADAGDGGLGARSGPDGDTDTPSGSLVPGAVGPWVVALVTATAVTWLVAYRRAQP